MGGVVYRRYVLKCWSVLLGIFPTAAVAQSQDFYEKKRLFFQLVQEAKESPIYGILTYSAFAIIGFVVAVLLIFLMIVLFKRH
jgi:hypothetical protein